LFVPTIRDLDGSSGLSQMATSSAASRSSGTGSVSASQVMPWSPTVPEGELRIGSDGAVAGADSEGPGPTDPGAVGAAD
jgi:hypothetical protein